MKETEKKTVKNGYGIDIVVCCASCRFKMLEDGKKRKCKLAGTETYPSEHCSSWKMEEHLGNAGKGGGRVRKKAWLQYVLDNGKSDTTQRMFERKNGSIYLGY